MIAGFLPSYYPPTPPIKFGFPNGENLQPGATCLSGSLTLSIQNNTGWWTVELVEGLGMEGNSLPKKASSFGATFGFNHILGESWRGFCRCWLRGAWRGQITTLRTSSTNPGRWWFFVVAETMSFPDGVGANFVRRCKMQHRWVTLSSGDEGFLWKVEEKSMENREVQSFWRVGLWRKFEVCCGVLVSFNIDIGFWNHAYLRYLWICTLNCRCSADVFISLFQKAEAQRKTIKRLFSSSSLSSSQSIPKPQQGTGHRCQGP